MIKDYSFVDYTPEFKERVIGLGQHLWSADPALSRAYFEWKHEQNPYSHGPVVILAVRGDEVVGMRTLTAGCWEIGRGRPPVALAYADDFVIAPAHRGSGLASDIMAALVPHARTMAAPYLISLSAGSITAMQSLASGWKSAGPMRPAERTWPSAKVVRAIRWVKKRFPVLAAAGETNRFASLDRHADDAGPVASNGGAGFSRPDTPAITITRVPRPEQMAQLVERLGHDGRIRHRREAAYFAWRFQNPLHDYRFLFLGGRELTGYLVLQTESTRSASRRVQVVDWEASDAEGLETLLGCAVSKGKFAILFTWEAAQPASGADILRRHRFEPADVAQQRRGLPSVLVRPTEPTSGEWVLGEHRVLDPANWDMRLLYSMAG